MVTIQRTMISSLCLSYTAVTSSIYSLNPKDYLTQRDTAK